MKKRQVVLSEELFDKYQDRYFQTYEENKTLQKKIGYLQALFDKEGNTQVIKYNGKLYRITSTTNYVEAGAEETLDFTAVLVRGVG
jgi:ribosomal protein S17E